jgi:hypothetical protein
LTHPRDRGADGDLTCAPAFIESSTVPPDEAALSFSGPARRPGS